MLIEFWVCKLIINLYYFRSIGIEKNVVIWSATQVIVNRLIATERSGLKLMVQLGSSLYYVLEEHLCGFVVRINCFFINDILWFVFFCWSIVLLGVVYSRSRISCCFSHSWLVIVWLDVVDRTVVPDVSDVAGGVIYVVIDNLALTVGKENVVRASSHLVSAVLLSAHIDISEIVLHAVTELVVALHIISTATHLINSVYLFITRTHIIIPISRWSSCCHQ